MHFLITEKIEEKKEGRGRGKRESGSKKSSDGEVFQKGSRKTWSSLKSSLRLHFRTKDKLGPMDFNKDSKDILKSVSILLRNFRSFKIINRYNPEIVLITSN